MLPFYGLIRLILVNIRSVEFAQASQYVFHIELEIAQSLMDPWLAASPLLGSTLSHALPGFLAHPQTCYPSYLTPPTSAASLLRRQPPEDLVGPFDLRSWAPAAREFIGLEDNLALVRLLQGLSERLTATDAMHDGEQRGLRLVWVRLVAEIRPSEIGSR